MSGGSLSSGSVSEAAKSTISSPASPAFQIGSADEKVNSVLQVGKQSLVSASPAMLQVGGSEVGQLSAGSSGNCELEGLGLLEKGEIPADSQQKKLEDDRFVSARMASDYVSQEQSLTGFQSTLAVKDTSGKTMSLTEAPSSNQIEQTQSAKADPSSSVMIHGKDTTVKAPKPIISSNTVKETKQDTRSYAKVVQVRTPALTTHEIEISMEDGVEFGRIPDALISNSVPLWEDFIVGKFPEKAPHIGKVHYIVNKIWKYGDQSLRIDAFVVNDKTIKFRIRDKLIREKILRRTMWNIAEKPMLVSNYGPVSEEPLPELKSMPLWIKVKNIPPSLFSLVGIFFFASKVGMPTKLHPETELCNVFDEAKVFVEVKLSGDLLKNYRFKSETGLDVEVEYEYPWLPPRCTNCKRWGHSQDICRSTETTTNVANSDASVNIEAAKVLSPTLQSPTEVSHGVNSPTKTTDCSTKLVATQDRVVEGHTSPIKNQQQVDTVVINGSPLKFIRRGEKPSPAENVNNEVSQDGNSYDILNETNEPEKNQDDSTWISPKTVGRKLSPQKPVEDGVVITSRFDILRAKNIDDVANLAIHDIEAAEKNDNTLQEIDSEEGEIIADTRLDDQLQEEVGSRQILPRSVRSTYKVQSSKQGNRSMVPTASGKRAQKKKS